MQTTINERIKILIDTLENGVSLRFAKKIGVSSSVVANYLPESERKGEPSLAVLRKIKEAYSQIRIDWIVTGEGEMLEERERPRQSVNVGKVRGHGNATGIDIDNKVDRSTEDQDCLNKLAVAIAEIEGYKREIARMEQTIASNQEMIKILAKSNI